MKLADNILIVGSNRGIGLELVKQLTAIDSPPTVFAVCRSPKDATELESLARNRPSIKILQLSDVRDYKSVDSLYKRVEAQVGKRGLNVLINNAGISMDLENLLDTTPEKMVTTYEINAVAPLNLTRTFLPLLIQAAKANAPMSMSCARAAVVNVTSKMGSISDNSSGGAYSYRASKTALNMITKSLAVDLKSENILVVCIHPGHVMTDMGGPNALITVDQSVSQIVSTLGKLNASSSGEFFNFDGVKLPW